MRKISSNLPPFCKRNAYFHQTANGGYFVDKPEVFHTPFSAKWKAFFSARERFSKNERNSTIYSTVWKFFRTSSTKRCKKEKFVL